MRVCVISSRSSSKRLTGKNIKLFKRVPILYHDVGQFYWGKASAWLEKKMHSDSLSYAVPKNKFVDINDFADWKFAEELYDLRRLEND